jgi:dienelactone hydrolase
MAPRVARCVAAALLALAAPAGAQQKIELDSLDRDAAGAPVRLTGDWLAAATVPAAAVVLLHGCGGAYDRRGRLGERMREYMALLHAEGFHVLVPDSLGPRGEHEICTQPIGTRRVTQANRRLDALGAVAWLAARPEVRADRIGLVGWSNGGSTVLAATNQGRTEVAKAVPKPAFAAAFYPGCDAELKRGYRAAAPLLLLVGEADDWTPAEPCRLLAARAGGASVQFEAFAGAYHGFDGDAPLRLRRDVPNGVHPGQGVHVGGDAVARERSRALLLEFVRRQR